MSIVRIIFHDVMEDGLMSQWDHRLGHIFGIFAYSGTKTTAEKNHFHDLALLCEQGRINQGHVRNRYDELATPFHYMLHLPDDFLLEVPRQDQNIIGFETVDDRGVKDRNMHSGRKASVLVRIAIDREIEKVGPDTAIIEQGITLARRSIAADALARIFAAIRNDSRSRLVRRVFSENCS